MITIWMEGPLGIFDEDVVALDIKEGVLGELRCALLVVVLVDQVGLCPEWAEANSLEHLPPCQVLSEGLLPDVDLKLKLPERNGESRRYVWFEKGGQSIKLPSFNIDLEDINMGMSIHLHERLEGIHGRCVVRTMLVRARQSEGLEMGAVAKRLWNFRSEGLYTEIIAPDLTVLGILQNLSLKRGLVVNSKGIDDAIRFLLYTRDTTNPFPTVSKGPEPLNLVWAIERCWEEVPNGIRRPRCLIRRENGNVLWCRTKLLDEPLSVREQFVVDTR